MARSGLIYCGPPLSLFKRHTLVNRALYQKRQETIERVFADAKEKHGMRWARYRGLKKTTLQAMLTFSALNLKKLANWSWDSGGNLCFSHYFIRLHKTNPHFNVEMRVCLQSEKVLRFLFLI